MSYCDNQLLMNKHTHKKVIDSKMPRLFVVFRTFDRIWVSSMFTREFSPLDMDTTTGGVHFIFQANDIVNIPGGQGQASMTEVSFLSNSFYVRPHQRHIPIFFGQQNHSLWRKSSKSSCCQPTSIYSCSQSHNLRVNDEMNNHYSFEASENLNNVSYFVLPKNKCTVVVDAHVASCINFEHHRSKTFRQRFFQKIRKICGFRNCITDYERWTEEERDAWDNYLSIPFMIDVIAVWPWQKIDYAWCYKILSLLHKHVMLEESLAWLSTLGGAHSSLGDSFIDHAEKAGEISIHQMKLARELGNEIIIARCYLYWGWSLLQRDYLAKCKICILNTWKYVKKMRCSDKILTNMCKAVWSRLQYKKSLTYKAKVRCSPGTIDSCYRDTDGSGCGVKQTGSNLQHNKSIKRSRIRMQPVEVY